MTLRCLAHVEPICDSLSPEISVNSGRRKGIIVPKGRKWGTSIGPTGYAGTIVPTG